MNKKKPHPVQQTGHGKDQISKAIITQPERKVKMYRDIYTWNVMDEIEKGKLVCVTDRQKGENFYCNGMTVNDLIELLRAAKEDKTNRYQFYCYDDGEKEDEQDA